MPRIHFETKAEVYLQQNTKGRRPKEKKISH
jgi:hypothetical protein